MSERPGATQLHSPFGAFVLERRPPTPDLPLQAWDAADEYLLDMFAEHERAQHHAATQARGHTLVINDAFGALALGLRDFKPCSWGDSRTAHLATAENFARNASIDTTTQIPATQPPTAPDALPYRAVLWRIPKTLALFQQQIVRLQGAIAADTFILAGGMIKHLPEQTVDLLSALGRVDILHARKKARLFRVTPQPDLPALAEPAPRLLRIPELGIELYADAKVFARDKFDIGARFFIEQFPRLPDAHHIADLGCGNGVLGIGLARLRPAAQIVFFDESYQAVASAAGNYARNVPVDTAGNAQFHCDDGLSHYVGHPFDLIVCNPPFHQNHATGDQIAWQMFAQSRQHLRAGGELWIVGNRHLDYHIKLKRLFGNCRQVAANPKFVVLAAVR